MSCGSPPSCVGFISLNCSWVSGFCQFMGSGDGVSLTDRLWWTRVFEYKASSGTGLVRRLRGVGLLSASLPVSLKSRYPRVRNGWIVGSSEAWVTSRLVEFSNKRDASS